MQSGGLFIHLVTALGAAVIGAAVALRLRQPLIIGYILAGLAIGPFTPGIMGDTDAIAELAEVGIVFLMFVIGAQLSLRALVRASRIALIGGLLQVGVMIAIGYLVGRALGWGHVEAYAFGAVLSNSSSTVLGKILSDRGELDSQHAQIGLAWSSVQDMSTVVLVAILGMVTPSATAVGPVLGKAALFFFVLIPLGFWGLPWLLRHAAAPRSREFFALSTITLALALAGLASVLGVMPARKAPRAGIVVGESDLSHRVLGDAIPMRDIFSGIFFVSIGMLLDPVFLVDSWALVLMGTTLIILVKGAVIAVLARGLGCSTRMAVLVGAALAQSAEFSFLLARIGLEADAITVPVFNLLLTATIVSILFAPTANDLAPRLLRWAQRRWPGVAPQPEAAPPAALAEHAIVCGYGRVGSIVCDLLQRHQRPYVVIEEDLRLIQSLRARGVQAVSGDAGLPSTLERAHVRTARLLALCIPEKMALRRALEYTREVNTTALVLARTHSADDRRFLRGHGVDDAVVGETELALEIGRRTLERLGVSSELVERSIAELRRATSE